VNLNSGNDQAFLNRLTAIVEANLSNEQFGVNELTAKTGLSRSQIHRRLKSSCNKSVSQFIREARLKKAKEFLEQGNLTVSEIAYKVGFGSPSYFIKSFHDYFGYPPGEYLYHVTEELAKKENGVSVENNASNIPEVTKTGKTFKLIFSLVVLISAVVIVYLTIQNGEIKKNKILNEKTILIDQLKNLSPDENKQYFAEGLSNTIRSQLGKIPGLKVIAGPTSEQSKDSTLSLIEIARQVKANYILTGSAQLQDNKVLINVYLINARQNNDLWTERYFKEVDDFFSTQIDIARNIAQNLQIVLSPKEIEQIKRLQPKNFDAWNNYQMGQYFCLKRDSASIRKGIEFFNKAIEIDSGYTLAYAGLADGYYALSFTGNVDSNTGYDMAYKMAEKALGKDSNLAEAYAVLGVVSYFGYWKWEEARKFFKKALEVDSTCMVAHLYYASFLDIVGEPDEALKHANRAIKLEPYYHMPYQVKGTIYHNEKKYMESTNALRRSIELNPESWRSYEYIFYNYIDLNEELSAVSILQEFFSNDSGYQKFKNEVKTIYETKGINGVLKLYLAATLEQCETDSPFLIPSLNARLGMPNEALTYLEKEYRVNEMDISRMIRMPELENLYSDPRFQAMVDTMNLRPYFQKPSR